MTTVAIMQPTFLPWLGYFAMIDHVDVFVFLDDVQCTKQSWQTRNRLKTSNAVLTVSVPCRRQRTNIRNTEIADLGFHRKLLITIQQSLARAPFVELVVDTLQKSFSLEHVTLGRLNCAVIKELNRILGINTPCFVSSRINSSDFSKSQKLIHISQNFGANTYLSPPGSLEYLTEDKAFSTSSVELRFFQFEHPIYPQLHGPFVSHLSAIDAIANIGPEDSLSLIRSSVRPSVDSNQLATKYR